MSSSASTVSDDEPTPSLSDLPVPHLSADPAVQADFAATLNALRLHSQALDATFDPVTRAQIRADLVELASQDLSDGDRAVASGLAVWRRMSGDQKRDLVQTVTDTMAEHPDGFDAIMSASTTRLTHEEEA